MLLIISENIDSDFEKVKSSLKEIKFQENKDKCTDCPFNGTGCPGGMWCTEMH